MESIAGPCDRVFTAVKDGKGCKYGSCVNGTCIVSSADCASLLLHAFMFLQLLNGIW